ncbi:MAG: ATP-binding protein [Paracoccaceae bacterium]
MLPQRNKAEGSVTALQQNVLTQTRVALSRWARRRNVQNGLALALVIIGPLLVLLTFLAFGTVERAAASQPLRAIVLVDLVYVIIVAALIAVRVARMVSARRAKSAGSQLHMRLTGVFTIIALVPTIMVAVFAAVTLNFGLEGWFSDRVRQVVGNSMSAAQAYENEHRINLQSDAKLLADFVISQKDRLGFLTGGQLRELLSQGQTQMQRPFREAYVIDSSGNIRARGERSYLFDFERPSGGEFDRAISGEIVIVEDWPNNEFRALMALPNFNDRFLYVTRDVDGKILSLLDQTRETATLYQQLESERGRLLFEFALIYLGFAIIIILAAVWLGLWFAERLSRPVGRLAGAAQRVGAGDLEVRVREEKGDDEIAILGRVFNRMTEQVKLQRDALMKTNEDIDRRRRLFDSVLSGVTAGVIGLDNEGRIELLNSAALRMLSLSGGSAYDLPISLAVPEFANLFQRLIEQGGSVSQGEVRLIRHRVSETLLVRFARREGDGGTLEGYVVTFDDVTDLVSAQRMAAWGDVARRIAHEIKNPLTPIQLSAERLRRKFAPMVGKDRDALEQYSDVIIRQTGDLRRIVDEFSKFARMPSPERSRLDLMEVLRDAVLLQRTARPDMAIELIGDEGSPVMVDIDATMINQALTNLMKNAVEAIDAEKDLEREKDRKGRLNVLLEVGGDKVAIRIQDNGIGLPEERSRLFEPYVTHRANGTGLGLSIVKKIIEEHAGELSLSDAPDFDGDGHVGAEARIVLPLSKENAAQEPPKGKTTKTTKEERVA